MSGEWFHTGLPAASGLQLPVCGECGHINYPARDLCGHCLADAQEWQPVAADGVLQSVSTLHYSLERVYSERLPWPVGSVLLDCGPVALAHMQPGLDVGSRVRLQICRDGAGNHLLVARADHDPDGESADWLRRIGYREAKA